MNRILTLLLALTAALTVSCTYDDSAIKQEIENQGKEIEALKQRVSALEAVQKAHAGDLFITGVTTLENGYTIRALECDYQGIGVDTPEDLARIEIQNYEL